MNLLFWALAAMAGAGFGTFARTSGVLDLNKGPSSVLFMFLSLVLISAVYQLRVNVARSRAKHGFRWIIAPPAPDLLVDAAAYFAGALLLLRGI